jgi:hypothetical protein
LKFSIRRTNIEFEIPDDWLTADLREWLQEPRAGTAYRVMSPPYPPDPQDIGIPQVEATLVRLDAIEPVERTLSTGTVFESKASLLRILTGFKSGQPLPPVHAREAIPGPYRYTLYNGAHRFYASLAAGFTHIPVVVSPRIKN